MKISRCVCVTTKPTFRSTSGVALLTAFVAFFSVTQLTASTAPERITLSELTSEQGFITTSNANFSAFGSRIGFAGDINGDGFDETLTTANDDTDGRGYVFVRYGTNAPLPNPVFATSNVPAGFYMRGLENQASIGSSLSSAGDVNGDGLDDFLIGAAQTRLGGYQRGEVFVVYGRRGQFPNPFDLSTLNGQNGYRIQGLASGSLLGSTVSPAGDLNGDGLDDIAVSAIGTRSNGMYRSGATYILFGQTQRNAFVDLNTLDGTNGFVVRGAGISQEFGGSISNIGDFNNDGHSDLAISGFGDNPGIPDPHFPGDVFIVYGGQNYPASIELLSAPANLGTRITGFDQFRATGGNVADAGDVNGDGIDDIVIGYHNQKPDQVTGKGAGLIVFGASNTGSVQTISNLRQNNRTVDFINFVPPYYPSADQGYRNPGIIVRGLGDLDRDGFDDILLQAPRALIERGFTYVIYGAAQIPDTVNAQFLGREAGHPGVKIRGVIGARGARRPVATGGDFNGDGYSDFMVGNAGFIANAEAVGQTYTVFGSERDAFLGSDPVDNPDNGGNGDNPPPAADRSLVAHHSFLNNIRDQSVYGNRTGKSTISYSRIAGDIGVNIGSGERVWSPSTKNLNVRGDISIAVSFNVNEPDGYAPVVAKYSDKRYRGLYQPSYGLELLRRGALRFFWIRPNDQFGWFCTTPKRVMNGRRKNNVVITRKKLSGKIEFWVNGSLVHDCQGRPGPLAEGARPLTLGYWSRGLYLLRESTLHIGELKIYRRILSDEEIEDFRPD